MGPVLDASKLIQGKCTALQVPGRVRRHNLEARQGYVDRAVLAASSEVAERRGRARGRCDVPRVLQRGPAGAMPCFGER